MTVGPLDLVRQIALMLDELEIPYVLGGSIASSFFGEPRSTVDIDLAVLLDGDRGDALLERATTVFYTPVDAAQKAIAAHTSFNLVDTANGFKIDIFVLGEGVLDRRQIERRTRVAIPGVDDGVWVTSPEDQVLRKLDWYRAGGSVSDRQWRDVVGILRVQADDLDLEYIKRTAEEVDLSDLVATALEQAY